MSEKIELGCQVVEVRSHEYFVQVWDKKTGDEILYIRFNYKGETLTKEGRAEI